MKFRHKNQRDILLTAEEHTSNSLAYLQLRTTAVEKAVT